MFFIIKNEQFAHSLFFNEPCEQITQVAHIIYQKWATMSKLLRSLTKNERIARFLRESLICSFFHKNPAIPSENQWEHSQPCNSLIFGERPERITHDHSFLVSNLSNLLTSLIKKEEMSKSLVFFQKPTKKNILVKFCWANSFFCELKSKWAICYEKKSNLLIYHEQPEQIAHSHSFFISDLRNSLTSHGCSFGMSNLSDSLTVTHLSWLIWANCSQLLIWFEPSDSERMRNKRMSKFPTLRICEELLTAAHMIWAIWLWANEQ